MSLDSAAYYETEISQRMMRGDFAGAASMAESCRNAWPDSTAGWLLGSIVGLLNNQREQALALIDHYLVAHPDNAQCLLQRAECLLALRQRDKSLDAAQAAARQTQDTPAALDALGEFFVQAGEHRQALEIYDRAVVVAPNQPTLRAKRADVHRFLGNLDLAAADYETVLGITPNAPKALTALVQMRRQSPERNSVAALKSALAMTAPRSPDAAMLNFALAKVYQDLGQYAESWTYLATGNSIERGQIEYEPETDRAVIESMIGGFPDAGLERAGKTGESPIFIVGLPRTGSTLIEQIISGHSQVSAGGEISILPEAIDIALDRSAGHTFPDRERFIAALHDVDGQLIAEEYLKLGRDQLGIRGRFTDKLLTNFLYCPMILRAFPEARIIHMTRHPMAACYAIYQTRFKGTNTYSYDLNEIAEFYIGYSRLMARWHAILPGRILDVAYEDVVAAIEPTTRRVLDYLGLPFEEQCLQFQENTAPVSTASVAQVRQPLYHSSLEMWKHYADQLSGVRAHLLAANIPLTT
jgi:tetratricopeptide (TPR) repeat protein